MYFRVDSTTNRIKHASAVPFTVTPAAGERDVERDVPIEPPLEPTHNRREWVWCGVTTTGLEIHASAVPPRAVIADGLGFLRGVHRNLSAVGVDAQFARAITLRTASLRIVDFVHNTSATPLSATRQRVAKDLWAAVKTDPVIGLAGSDVVNRLTALEISDVEADALRFGFSLA